MSTPSSSSASSPNGFSKDSPSAPLPQRIPYSVYDSAITKVANYFSFLIPEIIARTAPDGNEIKKNLGERMGDFGLSWIPTVPTIFSRFDKISTDPKFVALVSAVTTLFFITFMFYPSTTLKMMKVGHDVLNEKIPALPIIQFWTHIALTEVTLSYSLRALGRLTNKDLMDYFYGIN